MNSILDAILIFTAWLVLDIVLIAPWAISNYRRNRNV